MARQRTNRESRGKQMCTAQAATGREHLGHRATWPPSGMPDADNEAPAENRNGDVEAARGHDDEVALTSAQGVSDRRT